MDHQSIAESILALKNADLELRDKLAQRGALAEGYNEEMQQLHQKNATILNGLIDSIGYPTVDKVGQAASEAAWLVIQHAIGMPAFMKKCLELLTVAVNAQKANSMHLAYLSDRIAVLEGKAQLYGTQFDWDENGMLSPNPFDDLDKVNNRRKLLGLHTLEEQTASIRKRVAAERQSPPKDHEKRKQEMDEWRKEVGWLNKAVFGGKC